MQPKIKLHIKGKQSATSIFHVHPEMTAKQVTQLIFASSLLHEDRNNLNWSKNVPQAVVVSNRRNLMIEYLLGSTSTPISTICFIYQQLPKVYLVHHPDHLKLNRPNSRIMSLSEDTSFLDLDVLYNSNIGKRQGDNHFLYKYVQAQKPKKSLKKVKQSIFPIHREVELQKDGSGFIEKRMIPKETLKSFEHMEMVMIMRQRLIDFSAHHIDIFGHLELTALSKNSFIFFFKFAPKISLRQLLLFQLDQDQVQILINQVWLFINYMGSNGFQHFIINHVNHNSLHLFLDNILYDINGKFQISDITLILQKQNSSTNSSNCDKSILAQIKMYFNSRENKILPKNYHSQDQKAKTLKDIISFQDFSLLFNHNKYTLVYQAEEQYTPATKFFEWNLNEMDESTKNQVYEATTTKKQKKPNVSLRENKTRKNRQCSIFVPRKPKTKPKYKDKRIRSFHFK